MLDEVFFALCKSVDTPRSLAAWLCFKHAPKELVELPPIFDRLQDSDTFLKDYFVTEFLSKYKALAIDVDREAVALQRFTLSELQCKSTNEHILRFREGKLSYLESSKYIFSVNGVIHTARRKISRLLGKFSSEKVLHTVGWGPGATHEIPRVRAAVDTKMCELPITVTHGAEPYFRAVVQNDLHWSYCILGLFPEGPYSLCKTVFKVVDGCRIDTVPKSAKTDRVIAVEPRANAFLQKGVGGYLRKRLRQNGVNLNDQGVNQTLAGMASELGLATVDLSAASDTVAKELVFELLPPDWAFYLDALRSHYAEMSNGLLRLEKFSSMGNGFTFELESLIFWALASALTETLDSGGVVSVYGDDIICDSRITDGLEHLFLLLGFTMNVEKTHVDGLFRESCGAHWFDGAYVTPVYQKNEVDSIFEAIRLSNRLIRLAFRSGNWLWFDRTFEPGWEASLRLSETYVSRFAGGRRPVIPFGSEGDDGWLMPFDRLPKLRARLHYGLQCPIVFTSPKRLPACDEGLLAWSLRRGVITASPYQGTMTFSHKTPRVERGSRWIIPSRESSSIWQ